LYDIIERFKVDADDNLFDFTSTTDLVKKFVHNSTNEPAFALNNSDVLFDDSFEDKLENKKSRKTAKKSNQYKAYKKHTAPRQNNFYEDMKFDLEGEQVNSSVSKGVISDPAKTERRIKGIIKDNLLADQEESELDQIARSIEKEVSIIKEGQDSNQNERIVKHKFDKVSNFESLIKSKIDSFKFETKFSEIGFVVPSNDEFDFFIYQVIMGNDTYFEQYRVPDEHAQFFDRVLQRSQIISINANNYSQFEKFMSHEFQSFIATNSFIIMSIYLMGHPMGIIYAIPEDPDKQFNQADQEHFQQLSTHFYKGIETMVDIV
jgi:hypothetical protein